MSWAEMASTSHFPAMAQTTLAAIITRNCTPKPDAPDEIIAAQRFKQKWSPSEAAIHLRNEQRLQAVSQLAQNDSIDRVDIEDEAFKHWFEVAESYTREYQTTPEYPVAIQHLKRLFVAREHLPKQTHIPEIDGIDTHEFGVILRRLIEEL